MLDRRGRRARQPALAVASRASDLDAARGCANAASTLARPPRKACRRRSYTTGSRLMRRFPGARVGHGRIAVLRRQSLAHDQYSV